MGSPATTQQGCCAEQHRMHRGKPPHLGSCESLQQSFVRAQQVVISMVMGAELPSQLRPHTAQTHSSLCNQRSCSDSQGFQGSAAEGVRSFAQKLHKLPVFQTSHVAVSTAENDRLWSKPGLRAQSWCEPS